MKGDYSRWTVDPWRHFGAVIMQQGRVHTDADWNEWVATILRRVRADSLDTLHPVFVSDETPDAFLIAATGGTFTIGPGRMYVDGILVDNFGDDPVAWDPRMEELRGQGLVDYAAQPFYPNPPALPGGGEHLVYLKVWQRDVTAVEDPRIVEPALGVDTTTRLQTVWQVKVLPGAGNGGAIECDTELGDIPGFADAEPAAAGRLTTGTADVTGDPDPCLVPVGGGYKGLENQLYRVEIHSGGGLTGAGRATFKWSRDNGTVASRVTHIPALDRIVVESVGRDSELRFRDGDWIEVTDDWRELNGLPGEMRRVRTPGGVDDATRTILLEDPLPAGMFPVDAQDHTEPERNTRVQRWDQAGRVLKADGSPHVDLDTATSTGVIPVVTGTTSVLLEHGITVTFDLEGAGGVFRTGDHWLFAARTVDASVEILDRAPPRGIHAHYAKLATVTFPDDETDLRKCPPPPVESEGGCECDACVSVEQHASSARTIQDAVDEVIAAGGGTVCLGIGTYELAEPVRIHDARSIRLRGKGWGTLLLAAKGGQVVDVQTSIGVTVEDLAIITASPNGQTSAITLTRCIAATVENCAVLHVTGEGTASVAIGLEGYQLGTTVRRCALSASTGISGGARDDAIAVTASLRLVDNWMWCLERGIELERFTLHLADTRITGNLLFGCRDAGLVATGGNSADGALDISDNLCHVQASGIIVGVDDATIAGNDVRALEGEIPGDGIVLAPGLDPAGIEHCMVLGNRIRGVRGHGIAIRTRIESGMIKHNVIADTGGGGIVMDEAGEAGSLIVENNQLLGVTGALLRGTAHVGMLLVSVDRLDVAGNVVDEFAREVTSSGFRSAIAVAASGSTRVDANRVAGVAPPLEFGGAAIGVHVVPPFASVDAIGNLVRRRGNQDERIGTSLWIGILIGTPDLDSEARDFFAIGDVAVADAGERSFVMTGTRLRAVARREPGDVALRGNTVETEASAFSPVFVSLARGVRFSDNQIARIGDDGGEPSFLRCARAVVNANDLRDRIEQEVLRVEITGEGDAAIIGNLVSGPITLNAAQVPMDVLNPFSLE
jgi:Family of unknown function (DUF6519)/Right handed beta helix region